MTLNLDIKSCPCCGSEPSIYILTENMVPYICCKHCGYRVFGDGAIIDIAIKDVATMEEVIIAIAEVVNKWNRRV